MSPWKPVLLISFLAVAPALAEDMPHQLTPDLIQTERESCNTSTGYGVDFVQWVDIDGDGRKDVVLDYRAALCGGQPEPYCTRDGCLIKVWHAEKGGWRKIFDGRVGRWSVGTAGGKAELLIDGRPLR
ncbi:hypothetical protein [Pinisolibacter aquiterrae]|uniref:hypothetical protein n=1 Tax=Pinisolibacter aquiterrae TaxID=2815579 RepID=UPI001C3E169C|nr:hypothetical protein [Pinisolibacter aquiterrae]MBV5262970.1 hypothetical protein [Pinisolibacter aquiterrae]MCC8235312.1 hypothetical protein [Pinisolibacter aquiterrae]